MLQKIICMRVRGPLEEEVDFVEGGGALVLDGDSRLSSKSLVALSKIRAILTILEVVDFVVEVEVVEEGEDSLLVAKWDNKCLRGRRSASSSSGIWTIESQER